MGNTVSGQALLKTTCQVRVRYSDCDPQSMAHHGVFPIWLEMARTDLLRSLGASYRELEAQAIYFVVTEMATGVN